MKAKRQIRKSAKVVKTDIADRTRSPGKLPAQSMSSYNNLVSAIECLVQDARTGIKASGFLTWSHYLEILRADDPLEIASTNFICQTRINGAASWRHCWMKRQEARSRECEVWYNFSASRRIGYANGEDNGKSSSRNKPPLL